MTVDSKCLSKEIDIHDMDRFTAKKIIENYLNDPNFKVNELVIIHGYRRGNVLMNMVRKSLKHHRIKRKLLTLNPGETVLLLKY